MAPYYQVRQIAKSDYQLRHVCLSVCTHGRNFIKLPTSIFFEILSRKLNFRVNLTIKTAVLQEELRIFFINSRSFLTIKIFQRNFFRENQTHICDQKIIFRKIVTVKIKCGKILQSTVRYDLGLKNLLIKDKGLRNCPRGPH